MELPKLSQLSSLIPAPYKIAAGGIALVLGIVLILGLLHSCKQEHDDANINLVHQGAVTERSQTQSETINAIATAKQVTTAPTSDQLNSVCSHYDRNCH